MALRGLEPRGAPGGLPVAGVSVLGGNPGAAGAMDSATALSGVPTQARVARHHSHCLSSQRGKSLWVTNSLNIFEKKFDNCLCVVFQLRPLPPPAHGRRRVWFGCRSGGDVQAAGGGAGRALRQVGRRLHQGTAAAAAVRVFGDLGRRWCSALTTLFNTCWYLSLLF